MCAADGTGVQDLLQVMDAAPGPSERVPDGGWGGVGRGGGQGGLQMCLRFCVCYILEDREREREKRDQ